MENYLKLHRKMLDWGWYGDINTTRLFIHILLMANWLPGECYGIHYEAGEFITSLEKLSKETRLTISQVRTALKHLEMTGEIANKSQGKCRVITVNNWNVYQASSKVDSRKIAGKSQEDSREIATELDIKNKEIKKINIFVVPTVDEVKAYCNERKNNVDPEAFINFYASKGWMIGKNKMKDWKAAVRTWEKSEKDKTSKANKGLIKSNYNFDELESEAYG